MPLGVRLMAAKTTLQPNVWHFDDGLGVVDLFPANIPDVLAVGVYCKAVAAKLCVFSGRVSPITNSDIPVSCCDRLNLPESLGQIVSSLHSSLK